MIKKLFVVMVGLLVLPMLANATILDFTTKGDSATVNGAIFSVPLVSTGGAGTGNIDSFVRMQAANKLSESGYNTDGTLEFDTKGGIFTHSLSLFTIQTNIVEVSGIDYYEFILDVNESGTSNLITLHELEIYILNGKSYTGYNTAPAHFGISATPGYDLDGAGDMGLTLDYDNFAGSGAKVDMIALIPVSSLPAIGGDLNNSWVYLYSEFGQPDSDVDDGFEEWARKEEGTYTGGGNGVIPEPGTLILLGSGLAGLAGYGKLKFRCKRK